MEFVKLEYLAYIISTLYQYFVNISFSAKYRGNISKYHTYNVQYLLNIL